MDLAWHCEASDLNWLGMLDSEIAKRYCGPYSKRENLTEPTDSYYLAGWFLSNIVPHQLQLAHWPVDA
jgi:hypothetical protein